MGGDVIYKAYKNGTVYVEFIGPTNALIGGMTNVIGHYVPEVQAVKDYRDAIPKPGLDTPIGKAIQVVWMKDQPRRGRPWRSYLAYRRQGGYGLYSPGRMPRLRHGGRDT